MHQANSAIRALLHLSRQHSYGTQNSSIPSPSTSPRDGCGCGTFCANWVFLQDGVAPLRAPMPASGPDGLEGSAHMRLRVDIAKQSSVHEGRLLGLHDGLWAASRECQVCGVIVIPRSVRWRWRRVRACVHRHPLASAMLGKFPLADLNQLLLIKESGKENRSM